MENAKKNLVFHFGVGRQASSFQIGYVKSEGEVSENGHYLCLLPLIISPEQTTKMIWKDKEVSKVHFVL